MCFHVWEECPHFCTEAWVGDSVCDESNCILCPHFYNGDMFDGGDCNYDDYSSSMAGNCILLSNSDILAESKETVTKTMVCGRKSWIFYSIPPEGSVIGEAFFEGKMSVLVYGRNWLK